ncbi:MAG TPA: family 20 glycosylhydrolase [Bryobacteraceae bacterium]|nr:family 20 glycosylhydrolase [Bryobacteraceae bacterium]
MIKLAAWFFAASTLIAAEPNLMPWPAKIASGQGSLVIDQSFRVAFTGYQEPRLRAAEERFIARLSLETGLPLTRALAEGGSEATLVVHCDQAGERVQQLGEDESYHLEVTTGTARLDAPNPLGILRGLETFLQLVEPGPASFIAGAVLIEDHPRFPWRGLLLDVSRHWMPIEVVKRNLDAMAAVKLNVFHWHLSDDQGFRVQSLRFPKLQELGSDGLFYTQDQIRDVIAYARDRGIRVVPEFDMPGHTSSWLAAYPQLGSGPGPYAISRLWPAADVAMDPTRESTYEFLDAFIAEMAGLFPDRYFHIGGDEVNGHEWQANQSVQDFLRQHSLADDHALQAYFNQQVELILAKYGKRMEGWDEILDPSLPKDILIQSWRGQKSLAQATQLGFSGILSSGYYLDHMEAASALYSVDPLERESAALTAEEKSRILGGEAAMWAEFVDPENVDSRIWPRTAAIAERLWSPPNVKDVASMYRRLDVVSRDLVWLGLTHRSSYDLMLQRLAGDQSITSLKTLADVLEPANISQRMRAGKYSQNTPLNRLVDAVRPESQVAREFAALVDRMDRVQLRAWLTRWRDNGAKVRPLLESSFLLKQDIPVSENLSRLGSIGLQALEFIERNRRPPARWVAQQRVFIQDASKIHAEVRLAPAAPVEKLIEKAGR